MFDIAQWGIDKDDSGPTRIIPAGYRNCEFLTYEYNGGIITTEEPFDFIFSTNFVFLFFTDSVS